jgi:hypothetical protein
MQPEDRIDWWVVQHALLDHALRPTGRQFFGRLEQQLSRSRKFTFPVRQYASQPKQDRRMGIVPTGVHHTVVPGLVVDLVLFVNRQGIHIGANQYVSARSLGGTANQPCHTGLVDTGTDVLDTQRLQPLLHECRSFHLLKSQLRVLVEMAAIGNNPGQNLLDILGQFGNRDHEPRTPSECRCFYPHRKRRQRGAPSTIPDPALPANVPRS